VGSGAFGKSNVLKGSNAPAKYRLTLQRGETHKRPEQLQATSLKYSNATCSNAKYSSVKYSGIKYSGAKYSNDLQKKPIMPSIVCKDSDSVIADTNYRQQHGQILQTQQTKQTQFKENIVLPVYKCERNGRAEGLLDSAEQSYDTTVLAVALPHFSQKAPEFDKTNSHAAAITKTDFVAEKDEVPCEVDAISFF
jgi:hypothetical protein